MYYGKYSRYMHFNTTGSEINWYQRLFTLLLEKKKHKWLFKSTACWNLQSTNFQKSFTAFSRWNLYWNIIKSFFANRKNLSWLAQEFLIKTGIQPGPLIVWIHWLQPLDYGELMSRVLNNVFFSVINIWTILTLKYYCKQNKNINGSEVKLRSQYFTPSYVCLVGKFVNCKTWMKICI